MKGDLFLCHCRLKWFSEAPSPFFIVELNQVWGGFGFGFFAVVVGFLQACWYHYSWAHPHVLDFHRERTHTLKSCSTAEHDIK